MKPESKTPKARVEVCTGCKVRWLMSVIGRNQESTPRCPHCGARIAPQV